MLLCCLHLELLWRRYTLNEKKVQIVDTTCPCFSKEALLNSLPRLVGSLSSSVQCADSAVVAITTTE